MRRVLVTADDYGLDSRVNEAIEDLVARRAVDAVSVMVHADARLDGVARLAAAGVETGLHLVFTGGRPLAPEVARSPLGRSGRLPADWRALAVALARRPWLAGLLRREADAQAARYAGLGLRLDFVNGHEHAHLLPLVWPAARAVAARAPDVGVRAALGQPVGPTRLGLLAAASRLAFRLHPLRGRRVLSPLGVGNAGGLGLADVARQLARASSFADEVVPELVLHPRRRGGGEHELLASGAVARCLDRAS